MKLEAYGCIAILIDLEHYNENVNIRTGDHISLLEENKIIKIGEMISVEILKFYIRPDKTIVMAASLDLKNYIPVYIK